MIDTKALRDKAVKHNGLTAGESIACLVTIDDQEAKLARWRAVAESAEDRAQTAADEIERLREALEKIEQTGGEATTGDGHAQCRKIARAALQGDQHGQ